MKALRPMTHVLREQVAIAIKNGVDCSELIAPYEIQGESLAGVRCARFDRSQQAMRDVNLSGAWLPDAQLVQTDARGCNFAGANLERANAVSADLRGANLTNCFAPWAQWRYADLRNATLVGAVIRFHCAESYHAKFSQEFFESLAKHWIIEGWPPHG